MHVGTPRNETKTPECALRLLVPAGSVLGVTRGSSDLSFPSPDSELLVGEGVVRYRRVVCEGTTEGSGFLLHKRFPQQEGERTSLSRSTCS